MVEKGLEEKLSTVCTDEVIITTELLSEGELYTTVVTDKEDTMITSVVGRTSQEAVQEARESLEASLTGKKYHPRACVYSPHRDY